MARSRSLQELIDSTTKGEKPGAPFQSMAEAVQLDTSSGGGLAQGIVSKSITSATKSGLKTGIEKAGAKGIEGPLETFKEFGKGFTEGVKGDFSKQIASTKETLGFGPKPTAIPSSGIGGSAGVGSLPVGATAAPTAVGTLPTAGTAATSVSIPTVTTLGSGAGSGLVTAGALPSGLAATAGPATATAAGAGAGAAGAGALTGAAGAGAAAGAAGAGAAGAGVAGAAGAGAGVAGAGAGSSALASLLLLCHAAAEYYPWTSQEWRDIRRWFAEDWKGPIAYLWRAWYSRNSVWLAGKIRENPNLKRTLKPFFDWALHKSREIKD